MIRINLLGTPKPKKGKRGGGAPSFSGDGPNIIILLILGIGIGLGAAWYLNKDVEKETKRIQVETERETREAARLSNVDVKYEQRKKETDAFEKRVKVIDQLRADQSGPVNLLNTVGETVNNTDAVWLRTMNESGNTINIEGNALSTNAVANLMTNLKRTGQFKTVEIKDTSQDASNARDLQSFTFTLICEKQPNKS